MGRRKRSSFIDMLGVPKDTDLRTKPKCAICGRTITRKTFGMESSTLVGTAEDGNLIWDQKSYCSDCFLKPKEGI